MSEQTYQSIARQVTAFFGPRLRHRNDRDEILDEICQEAYLLHLEGKNFKNAADHVLRIIHERKGRQGKYHAESLHDNMLFVLDIPTLDSSLSTLSPEEKDVAGLLIAGSGQMGYHVRTVSGIATRLNRDLSEVQGILERLHSDEFIDEILRARKRVCPVRHRRKESETRHGRWYRRQRNLGLCVCGVVTTEGFANCADCRRKSKKRSSQKYDKYRLKGLCLYCGGTNPCLRHIKANRLSSLKYYHAKKKKQAQRKKKTESTDGTTSQKETQG